MPQSNVHPHVLLQAEGVSTSRRAKEESHIFYCLIPDSRPDEAHHVAGSGWGGGIYIHVERSSCQEEICVSLCCKQDHIYHIYLSDAVEACNNVSCTCACVCVCLWYE